MRLIIIIMEAQQNFLALPKTNWLNNNIINICVVVGIIIMRELTVIATLVWPCCDAYDLK